MLKGSEIVTAWTMELNAIEFPSLSMTEKKQGGIKRREEGSSAPLKMEYLRGT